MGAPIAAQRLYHLRLFHISILAPCHRFCLAEFCGVTGRTPRVVLVVVLVAGVASPSAAVQGTYFVLWFRGNSATRLGLACGFGDRT